MGLVGLETFIASRSSIAASGGSQSAGQGIGNGVDPLLLGFG